MQSGGGNPMNAAQLARLQQQLAQYGRSNGQQQMMNPNAMGGMGNQQSQQQQLQQAFMQQQLQQQGQGQGQGQGQQGGMQVRRNSALGMNSNSAAALAMMQQQQQQQQQAGAGGSQMANANMSSYWNALQNQNTGTMDASTASSAQLAALAGMNMNNTNSSQNNAASMLLGNRSSQPQQQAAQGMGGNQPAQAGMGQTTDANLLQQQIAQLQRQLQQQQQGQQPQPASQGMNMQGSSGLDGRNSASNFGGMQGNQQQQQQLYQQMQMANGMMGQDGMAMGQNKMGNDQFGSMNNMMPGQNMRSTGTSSQGMMPGSRGGLSEQELLQQQILRSSGMSQSMQADAQKTQEMFMGQNNQADMGQRRTSVQQQQQMDGSGMGSTRQANMGGGFNNNAGFDMDGSVHSQRSAGHQSQNKGNSSPLDVASGQMAGDKADDPIATQKSFLDGSFAGGWQSNADLPDRRRVIFSILEVIRQMRPDTNKISQKLPHMAKSLEEHLYRSAQTKEEYLDPSTLKKRLQLIAHGLEIHRSTSSGSVNSTTQNKNNSAGGVPSENQQLQQFLAMQQGNNMNQGMGGNNALPGMGGSNNGMQNSLQGFGGGMDTSMNSMSQSQNAAMLKGDGSNYQDRIAAQKKKVIRQQQQRLLLLRHASKCKEGPNCKTKFCAQMMTLWKHMKKCRDKNCKTSHCLSSRCVLNHYRICKSQGRTATCEVCGPVMEQIKRQDHEGSMDGSDPLAAKPDPDLPNQALPQLNQQMSGFGQGNQQNNVQAMQQQAMQQLYQQQQQALQQNQAGAQGMQNPQMQQNSLQALGGGGMINQMQNDPLQGSQSGGNQQQDPQQMQNLQNAQQKLQHQQNVLRQLQKQQNQLLEQQKQLQEQQALLKDPGTQQAQQLQQQHQLLQQLQRRCQQQQALIQQELMLQMKALGQSGQDMTSLQQQMGQSVGNNSQGSQQMGNSQNSHHSQGSNQMSQSNNMAANQNQMQAMNQAQMPGMGDKSNDTMNQMQNQMQNPMHGQSSSQEEQLLQMQQALNAQQQQQQQQQESNNIQNQSQQQDPGDSLPAQQDNEESQEDEDDGPGNDALGEVPKPSAQPLSDGEGSADSKPANPTVRPKPAAGRGKGARGRGGKGKRLRDIADDLGSAGATLSATDSTSMVSRKRSLDHLGGDDDGPSSKVQRSGDPLPDSEKSTAADGEGDPSSSLTSSMPKGDVEQHLLLLHKGLHLTSRTITHKCLPIVQQLIDDPFGWVFRDAVDPVVFGLPDYFEVVKNPMHLLLVKKKLENAVYTDMASFERDVKLVFENAILYNGDESEVGQLAQTMMGVFEREYKKVCEVTRNELAPIGPNACKLCGLERRRFQPPVLWCVGMSCGGQKIKRNALYYTKGSQQNIWCEKCYSKLKENESIMLDDGSETRKARLHEVKNNSNPEETWVRCDDCKVDVHQVCALTNDRIRNPEEKFFCPKCDLKNRRGLDLKPSKFDRRAEDLEKCEMSDFMEEGLLKNLKTAYESRAKEMNNPVEEVEKAEGIFIRVLSHITKKHTVRDEMYNLYSKAGCPSDYPAHTKCVGLFQKIDGVDVLLFAMYVYEYGHDCPAPNRRRVYISYLDSVQYFEPRMFRTVAYQSIITEYLRFVKKRGFHTAHIWSCPPTPGDEYVFYCHPQSQKIPQEEKLRNWYIGILEKAKEDGIVLETTNFYEEYFANSGENAPGATAANPMSLPYFEGDYIPGEIEGILSSLTKEEKRNLPIASALPRRSGSKLGTRSNPGSLLSQTQDKIMLRLGSAIFNMKENLMIVRLRSKSFVAAVERGDDVSGWPEDEESLPLTKGKDSSVLGNVKKEDVDVDAPGDESDPDNSGQLEMALVLSRAFSNTRGPQIGNAVEKDPQFESELFENRQLFLNYCQRNRCQFDDLRKAKHSTMMVLFQLHTPVAPKFLQQCGACHRDIAHGNRFHCNICANYDLCDECYKPVTSGTWAARGARYVHDYSHSFSRISLKETAEAKKSQEERTKSLQGYLEVLAHVANCPGAPSCKLNNCEKMKKLFVHVHTCDLTYLKGCKVCHRLVSLIIIHARSCDVRGSCSLPFCDKIRERNERVRRQQQLMDDRRRQAQNSYYGAGDS